MRQGAKGSSVRVLVAAMALVVSCFAVAIVYFERSALRVQRETEGMLTNSVPSADRLTLVRTSLRKLDGALDQALLDCMEGRPFDRSAVLSARRAIDDELASYRLLPYYDGEVDLNRKMDEVLRHLDGTLQGLSSQLASGQLQAAHAIENGAWRSESDQLDEELRALTRFNVEHLTEHALRIDEIRKRASLVGIGLGVFNFIVALLATVIAAGAVRRQVRVQEARAAELEMFSARVAHDLMSPLAAVSLALDLNQRDPESRNSTRRTGNALSAIKRVRLIVDGLLDFAHAGGMAPSGAQASVGEIMVGVLDELRPQAQKERIEIECPPFDACQVACAPGILIVLVTNLLRNAIKFMGEAVERRITLRIAVAAGSVRFDVDDTGPGLPEGFDQLAFQPYVRGSTVTPGIGLGLATVKRLVEAHGGQVGVVTARASGVSFWFELPRPPASAPQRVA